MRTPPSHRAQRHYTWDERPGGELYPPEWLLWCAVFVDALEVLEGHGVYADARQRQCARNWMRSTDHRPGSFEWVCEYLGLNAMAVRRALGNGRGH
jgi:hypothetical protein